MTKSGIGTQANANSSNSTTNTSSGSSTSTTTTLTSSSSLISNAEIPIWVADKKKWVTGISKKTTINDLIYAILKQCQLIQPQSSQSNLTNQFEMIANQYVLVEYTLETNTTSNDLTNTNSIEQISVSSQRILNGDSKVYKYLTKWANSQLMSTQQQQQPQSLNHSNLMLKILQRQPELNSDHDPSSLNNHQQQQHQSTSLATKLLKKFGVNNNNNLNQSTTNTTNSKTVSNHNNNHNTSSTQSFKLVDVKLPQLTASQSQPNQLNSNSLAASSKSPQLNQQQQQQRNFDPNTQKSFLYNAILEKDNRLKQQTKRFQLIDELIKETEKKTTKFNNNLTTNTSVLLNQLNTDSVINNPTYTYSPSQSSSLSSTNSSSSNSNQNNQTVPNNNMNSTNLDLKQLNTVDLNDVYCHFPEMCTHHLKEVEDFTLMCSQLFQLEEAIKTQKQVLSNLELDLQRELTQNQFNHQQQQHPQPQQIISESSETVELRNEVNYSREQTRLQCKQLHDLDLRMRQNEQSLMLKEQQLQQLLEELYIQEIYADNALESAITSTTPSTQMFSNPIMNFSPKQVDATNTSNEDHFDAARHSELIIKNEFDNSKYLTKRHVKMFGDSNDDMLINQALQQQQQQSLKLNSNQVIMSNQYINSNLQQKSQSIGNLAKCLPSPPQVPPTVLAPNQSNAIKTSKTTNFANTTNNTTNLNSDHSGDNDSGISSMSSETTINGTTTNNHSTPPPYLQQQHQQRIQHQQQQIYQTQFNQMYRQQQQQSQVQQSLLNASPVGKSVLETLV